MLEARSQTRPWYAVQTRPKWEKPSAAMLAEKGYEVFYPSHVAAGAREQPLFPSYLFCRATKENLGRIVTTPGVIRLLGRPGKPEAVPDAEIASVQRLLNAGMPVQAEPVISVGGRVRILQGPLAGIEGEVTGEATEQRLSVSVYLLQRRISVTMDPAWLRSVPAEPVI